MSGTLVADSNVLITGGQGFIGAWLAARLASAANTVTLLDNGPCIGSCAEALCLNERANVHFVNEDAREPGSLTSLGEDFDYVVHAAGVLGIRRVVQQPVLTLDVNIRATHNILDFCLRQRDIKRVLLLSTSEIYGRAASGVQESSPAVIDTDSSRWGYAASKLAAEFLGRAYHEQHGLPVVTVRPFNVYGPHRVGSNAMTTLVARSLRGQDLVLSGDGKQTRSWCSIIDFVDGLERCLTAPSAIGEVFNLGDDRTTLSLFDLAEKIVARTSSSSRIRLQGDSTPDVRSRRPVIDKARDMLGYAPQMSLGDGIDGVAEALRRRTEAAAQQ